MIPAMTKRNLMIAKVCGIVGGAFDRECTKFTVKNGGYLEIRNPSEVEPGKMELYFFNYTNDTNWSLQRIK